MKDLKLCHFCFVFCCLFATFASATDTLPANETLADGETLTSASGYFELGFFTPKNDGERRRYLGIWYKFSTETVVWVANRGAPITGGSGALRIAKDGILHLVDGRNLTVWSSSNVSSSKGEKPVAQMLDNGNLVVMDGGDFVWQSFDHLSNTMLPSAKFGKNLVTGEDNYLTSWKSESDPSFGDTINKLDTNGYPQIFMTVKGLIVFRSGPWNGLSFGGVNNLHPNPIFSYQLIYTETEIYYRYDLIDKTTFSRFVISDPAVVQRFNWNISSARWSLYLSLELDECDVFGKCGAFGSCAFNNSASCSCLEGFSPRNLVEWESGNWSGGCVRRNPVVCGGNYQNFQRIDGVKLPDTRASWFNKTMSLSQCKSTCLSNCSCSAYATLDISMGNGCLLWFNDLLDIKQYNGNGQTFYLRLSGGSGEDDGLVKSGNHRYIGVIVTVVLTVIVILLVATILYIRHKRKRYRAILRTSANTNEEDDDLGLPLFEFAAIETATAGFANFNKIGEGGFGPVYKGTLRDGREIAVKRLAKTSGQGMVEFKNEVILIAKLQHRNLVRLFGCCIHGEERLLIYEYMPNKSLDYFIFDKTRRKVLGWEKLTAIITDIARGLLYLHHESRLRIIHRDLKASNVLLDADLNPKISDFGMARMFKSDQHMANTKNVVGTYGYMSPEYAVDGVFSTKSDVFSFGVLVLEIISGKRNRAFTHPDHSHNLLGHAWKLWIEKRPLDFIDEDFDESMSASEILRCVQVGLLCVQQRPEERPDMTKVVLMLCSDTVLPLPSKPGFFTERSMPDSDYSSSNYDPISVNHVSITTLQAR